MDLGLKGKGALVTGASSGLGAACALALAAEGVNVVINSRNRDKLEACAQKIRSATGRPVSIVVGDLTKSDDVTRTYAESVQALPNARIDVLVSNTGGPAAGYFLELPKEKWEESYNLILKSAVDLTRAVLPAMIEHKWGRLIYITSVAAIQPVDDLVLSNTFRAGLTGFCKTVSNTYAQHGITANTVCPGYTATERLTELAAKRAERSGTTVDDVLSNFARLSPIGRIGRPEELAALVAFLSSERAAFITGSSIAVDGGAHRSLL
jgi:3-oxoacyl-[acyl-carrier protein] reductase